LSANCLPQSRCDRDSDPQDLPLPVSSTLICSGTVIYHIQCHSKEIAERRTYYYIQCYSNAILEELLNAVHTNTLAS
jgi:hypothetical protein